VSVEKHLTYRGDIRAAVGVGGTVAFVTLHPEGLATGLYRLDADALTLDLVPLPAGGLALAEDGGTHWIGGSDRQVYEVAGDKVRALGAASGLLSSVKARVGALAGKPPATPALPTAPTALAPLADGRLAVLAGSEVVILGRVDGKPIQTLELPEPGTCLAADRSGRWLVAGTSGGTVAVFDAEDRPEFVTGEASRLHEGAVTALLFEPDELRFLSAGADLKLLSTHARGKLEPEDKGRANSHADVVTSLIWGPGDRLYSGSRDGTIKSWPRVGAVKPATIKDGVGRVVALALVRVHDRPRLVAACDDNTLRVFPTDAAGKVGELSHKVHDAYARARVELGHDEARRRQAALDELAALGDVRAVELISEQVGRDPDHGLRQAAARMLGDSPLPRASALLEPWLGHADEAVRVAAFEGLRKHLGAADLKPLDLALKAEKADVGKRAVRALGGLAKTDDRAMARLLEALDAKVFEVRQDALGALETVHDPRSPEADLVGLGSKHADVRRLALVRLHQRGMLDDPAVQSALRRRAEDADPEVRRLAFLLALHARPKLLQALRSHDPELQRQLDELEGRDQAEAAKAKGRKGAPAAGRADLDDADVAPLLQATASRALDTCLRGARGLALLGDPRAFGLLLQLSREEDKTARAEVCRAMGALDDPRAVERLGSMLHDAEAEVRDAAFSALSRLHADDPLRAAETGLNASAEDVRRRGLQALIAEVRKAPPRSPDEPAWPLLLRALNDSFPGVRAEAFKAALNLQLAGGGAGTLRLAMRSVHADVRREALTEVTAQLAEPWGWDVLLEFFNDPEPSLRADAFALAVKKTKGLEFLDAGLGSRHPDIRKMSVEALVKKHTPAAQALLVRALDDEERDVRLKALEALVAADARAVLAKALDSPHADVRLRAAKALARHGDRAALPPLLALASAPEPTEEERRKDWSDLVESALDGLGELGDPSSLPTIIPLLDSPHAAIRWQAARALTWVARDETLAAPRQALPHADPEVKYHAALGLAYAGDATMSSLVFSTEAAKVLSVGERLGAAAALGPAGEDRLAVFLDHDKEPVRARALLLLLMRQWKDPDATAARLLAGLSARLPRMRLTAARGLEALADDDPSAFARFVVEQVNDRGDKPAWQIPDATVDALAELLVHAEPRLRARTARLLNHLDADEQAAWDQAWAVLKTRFAEDLATLQKRARARRMPRYDADELRAVAFGAYVGLVREQGGSRGKGKADAPDAAQVTRVRQTALGRIVALARTDPRAASSARPVFVQALGDPNQAVRLLAFEHLGALGMPPAELAGEALATGHTDIGVKGLELLSGGGTAAKGQAVLERAMLSRKDALAIEAARLLIAHLGTVAVAGKALEASHEPMRTQAISWLAAEEKDAEAARGLLRRALGSKYREVREAAALALATRKDPAAFEALVKLLEGAGQPSPQRRIIQALVSLGDPRAPSALLDRLENDPTGTAQADDLLRAAGSFRRPEDADRLLAHLGKDRKWRDAAFAAALVVSGHDQEIEDPDDEEPDRRWEEEQFPRRDDILARLMERLSALNDVRLLARLMESARWARGKQVDAALAGLTNHPDESLRREAIEALGWRARRRGASPDALVGALRHRDPVSQFLAAEALAKVGRGEGLTVLLAAIDYVTDLGLRRRAVLALGELADERALDTLLRLAAEDGHALQDQAAEAIGHLGRSDKADAIFAILERHAKGSGTVAFDALKGLRWLDSRDGWQLIRRRAADETFPRRYSAVEQLGFNDEPATRDLLLRLLAEDESWPVVREAMAAARRIWGMDSLEPDYALLQSGEAERFSLVEQVEGAAARVCERGEPGRIFGVLARCGDEIWQMLATALLNRPELPVAEALAALDGAAPRTAGLAARILGRAGKTAPRLVEALRKVRESWEKRRAKSVQEEFDDDQVDTLTVGLCDLVWAAGRLGIARDELIAMAGARPDDPAYRPIRREAVAALAAGGATAEVVAALEDAATRGDPEVRALAAEAVGRLAPDRARALALRLLSDRASFDRLALVGDGIPDRDTLRSAARQVHAQGVVLPYLIDRGDVNGLAAVAEDRTLSETARLGAVEALGATGLEAADAALRRIGESTAEDEELRKAAWRALRRSKRTRRKAEVTP
jgi:ParB family chromosome partitioning protein